MPDSTTDMVEEVFTGSKVEFGWQVAVMVLNLAGPVVAGIASVVTMFGAGILPKDYEGYASTAGETVTPVSAAGWTFAIWGIIYPGLATFAVYQALPSEWVPQRNDELIYYYMNLIPIINFVANASWFPFAFENNKWSLIMSTLVIWTMLATALGCMIIADQHEVWWPEVFTIRIPWSIYAGWLIAATILSTTSMFKMMGMRDQQTSEWYAKYPDAWNFLEPLMFISEEEWGIVTLWTAEIFVEIIAWSNRDPIFGLVFAWAAAGVISETITDRPQNENFLINISTITGIHAMSMITLISYIIFETFQPWYEPFSFWGGGTFGMTNWGEMLTDLNWVLKEIETFFVDTVDGREALI